MSGYDVFMKAGAIIAEIPKVMSRASTDAAEGLEDVIAEQFIGGHDPHGNRWKAKKDGTASHLFKTGALAAVRVVPMPGAGVVVEFDEPYATYHQHGTSKMPARPLAPEDGDFESSLWHAPIEKAYVLALERQLARLK